MAASVKTAVAAVLVSRVMASRVQVLRAVRAAARLSKLRCCQPSEATFRVAFFIRKNQRISSSGTTDMPTRSRASSGWLGSSRIFTGRRCTTLV
ncbi:hypothetical protein D3C78_1828890 [compost metagenome]